MNPSGKPARSGTRGYAHLVEIDVPMSRVWRALTDPALIRIWSADEAELDARRGGFYRLGRRNAGGREALIDVFEVNRRLRLIYLDHADAPTRGSAVVDDFLLDLRTDRGPVALRVLGSGIPESEAWDRPYARMRSRWERMLARMKVTLESPPQPRPASPTPRDPPLPGLDF